MKANSLLIDVRRSESKNYNPNKESYKAYDGDYSTFYSVKDHETSDNYLKLFLDGIYVISTVNVTNRLDGFFGRFAGTAVEVRTTDRTRFGRLSTVERCGDPIPGHYIHQRAIFCLLSSRSPMLQDTVRVQPAQNTAREQTTLNVTSNNTARSTFTFKHCPIR